MANDNNVKESSGFFQKIKKFFSDQRGEIKRIVWPSKKQVINNTAIVIGVVVMSSILIGGFDAILGAVVKMLFGA